MADVPQAPSNLASGEGQGRDRSADRARIIAAIYDAVLKPQHYDDLMLLWEEHLTETIREIERQRAVEDAIDGAVDDPEMQAHFERALEMLERFGRITPEPDAAANWTTPTLRLSRTGQPLRAPNGSDGPSPADELDGFRERLDVESERRFANLLARIDELPTGRRLSLLRTEEANDASRYFVASVQDDAAEDERTVLLQSVDIPWSDALAEVLVGTFELTAAELTIVRALASGKSLPAIAIDRGRSEHTVRSQAKSIMRKMEISAQTELVRMVATLAQLVSQTEEATLPAGLRRASGGRSQLFGLPDGRNLEIQQFGAPLGRPILFMHSMLDSTAALERAEAGLTERNWRVICPVRPHYGRSDPHSDRVNYASAIAVDMGHLLDAMNVRRPLILGHMGGSVHAYTMLAMLGVSRPFAGLVNVSGCVPIVSAAQFKPMSRRQRVVAHTARFTPRLLPTLLRIGLSQIDTDDVDRFIAGLYRDGTHDAAAIEQLGIAQQFRDAYRHSGFQSYRGFEFDSFLAVRDWSAYVDACRVPAIHLHGRHDPAVAIETVRDFARRHPHIELREYDLGQLIFYERPDLVFDAIEDAFAAGSPPARRGAVHDPASHEDAA